MNKIEQISKLISEADAILVGAGAGLSTAAGFTYSGERFEKSFSDFIAKYHFEDMYSGGFYPFETLEEHWAYWSRYIYVNRYECAAGKVYTDLFQLLKDKEYFVQKAVGWTLRESYNVYPKQTFQFIEENVKNISPTAFTTCLEKMTEKEKTILKQKRNLC